MVLPQCALPFVTLLWLRLDDPSREFSSRIRIPHICADARARQHRATSEEATALSTTDILPDSRDWRHAPLIGVPHDTPLACFVVHAYFFSVSTFIFASHYFELNLLALGEVRAVSLGIRSRVRVDSGVSQTKHIHSSQEPTLHLVVVVQTATLYIGNFRLLHFNIDHVRAKTAHK